MTKLEPKIAPSVKKSKRILIFSMLVGAALGMYMAISLAEAPGEFDFFSNSPINSTVAAVAIAVWLLIVPPLTFVWWRNVDEHEKDAYREGAMVSAHAYIFLVPSWWLGTRAGWLPDQDPMIVLVLVGIVWSAVWLYRKYF